MFEDHDLDYLCADLREFFETDAEFEFWMDVPNRSLGDKSPNDILNSDDAEPLWNMLDGMYQDSVVLSPE